MVTVFLTDEAEDILLEEFAENGLPQMPDAEWTSDKDGRTHKSYDIIV